MKIALIGSTGLVGQALQNFLLSLGNECVAFKRNHKGEYAFDSNDFIGIDAVINLAGEPVSQKWSESIKQKIKESRVNTTKALSLALEKLKSPPEVIINASAIGYYGDGKDKLFDEFSPPGHDFLSQVVVDWEKALHVPSSRTVFARFGIILSNNGGALKKMLLPFKLGFGGKTGDGNQFMSWIDIDDVVRSLYHIIKDQAISGPVNIVSPYPVRNIMFTKTLANVLNRPSLLSIPKFAVQWIFGEMGNALLLSSIRVEPKVLMDSGYKFLYPYLEKTLEHEIIDDRN